MKLETILEDMDAQVSQQLKRALTNAGWKETYDENPKGATFMTRYQKNGTTEFRVPVINNRNGGIEEPGQISSALFNSVIDPYYRQARAAGISFTQPVGMPGLGFENERFSGVVMQFFVG